MYPVHPILLVDDDIDMLRVLELTLRSRGISNLVILNDASAIHGLLAAKPVCLILLDLRMPGVQGFDLLQSIREQYPAVPVIMITGENDLETAVRCMRLGARDYLSKPVEPRRLLASITQTLELGEIREEYRAFVERSIQDRLEHPEAFADIIAESPNMRSIFHYVETIALSRKPVLITGESGVGKELIAQAVHRVSGVTGPFVSETVAGFDDNMFSDALFGHVPGAFTGASTRRQGLVQSAESGTLFLDEIGDLSVASQVKLLRLLQEREYRALGSDKTQRATARFVFATNRDLSAMRDAGTFRGDLFYRISTHSIVIPPLRQRRRDIAPLIRHFVGKAARELEKGAPQIPEALIQLMDTYAFPGNVRELEAMAFDAVAKANGHSLALEHFGPLFARDHAPSGGAPLESAGQDAALNIFTGMDALPDLCSVQVQLIEEAMRRADQNQGIAARLLGISRTALNKRLRHAGHALDEDPNE
jgi:DNA-binding NtrC family response regulator